MKVSIGRSLGKQGRFGRYSRSFFLALLLALSAGTISLLAGILKTLFSLEVLFFALVPGYALSIIFFKSLGKSEWLLLSLGISMGLFVGILVIGRMNGFTDNTLPRLILPIMTTAVLLPLTIATMKKAAR